MIRRQSNVNWTLHLSGCLSLCAWSSFQSSPSSSMYPKFRRLYPQNTSVPSFIIRPRVKKPGLDPTDPASYRPISNLSFISKLVERVIHKQLSDYVESL